MSNEETPHTTSSKTHPSTTNNDNLGVFTTPTHDLYLSPTPTPALSAGEILVSVKSTGICGSDVHFWKSGRIGPMVVSSPHILGHESAGEVIAVHPSVVTHQPGDRVAIEPNIICGECTPCLTGRYNGCEKVEFRSTPPIPGLLRRYVAHHAKWCHKIGDLSFEQGALLEPLSVALAGLKRAQLALGDVVMICGAGPIGLVTLACARAAGAEPVLITDVDEGRLRFAREFASGVRTLLVKPGTVEEFAEEVKQLMGVEPDLVMECTGVEASIAGAIQAVRFGGKVFVIGVGKEEIKVPFMRLSTREVDLQFQYRYANTWPKAIRLMRGGIVDLRRLVTHRFKLEEAKEAFEVAADVKRGGIKVMIQNL
ncbi:L-arabinitol 4-dehydrogenase [Piedraia hortae CBS 480.64]|uniref:L-arabinitol 4-dehydrogenase n=1 Tax=Piedraia hortae CBS 480.64 TaxID=1314780 RepID=A0A6A7C5M2_9PEZI|nr:L-arabinitol 4-dehydrogenase [Piedraia hortae CBS 480.64]